MIGISLKRLICFLFLVLLGNPAIAGVFEAGASFSSTRSVFNGNSYTSTQTWAASLGYYFTQDSEIEFTYQDGKTRNFVEGIQDVSFRDRVYSLNLNYHLASEEQDIRPYLRLGAGQLNRDASGSYANGSSPPGRLDQLTIILGLGAKIRVTQRIGLRAEFVSYLIGGNLSTWKDNTQLSAGISVFF